MAISTGKERRYGSFTPGVLDFRTGSESSEEKSERPAVLACCKEALLHLDNLYNTLHPEPNNPHENPYYPHNISNKSIRAAAQADPRIFSPYTIVEIQGGQLHAREYSEAFAVELEGVIKWVQEAASVTLNPDFRDYLKAVGRELEHGEQVHEETVATWLNMKEEPEIDAVAGFLDRYGDRRFNQKFDPQGWTGRLDRQQTPQLQSFANGQVETALVLPQLRSGLVLTGPNGPNVRVRADITERFGGLAKTIQPNGNNLPCEQELRDRYGAKITIFIPQLTRRVEQHIIPSIKKVIPFESRHQWKDDDLIKVGSLLITAHEVSHSLNRRPGDQDRFINTYGYMNEMDATVRGLAIVGQRTDVDEEVKRMMIALMFGTAVDLLDAYKKGNRNRKVYLDGYETIFSNLVESKTVRVDREGYIKFRTQDVYNQLMRFALDLEDILTNHGKSRARKLRGSFEAFPSLQQLRPFRDRPPQDSIAKVA